MDYEITSLKGSAKDIIHRVMDADVSQVLIPETYQGMDPVIQGPPSHDKYIGLFSSGTTGTPKCVWNRYDHLLQNARNSAEAFGVDHNHTILMMALPWHVAGFSWMLMAEQLRCEYRFITTKKGEEELWLQEAQEYSADYLMTVPAVLRGLYENEWFVENVVYGGYPIRFKEYKELSPHCDFMYQGYGQTEAGGLISCYRRRSEDQPQKNEHLCHGKPIRGVGLSCKGSVSQPDSIYIESETAFTGVRYDSGDLGYFDDAGNIYVTGRNSDFDNSTKGVG